VLPRIGAQGEGFLVTVRVQPRAGRDAVVGVAGEALKVKLAAPPVDGKANEALVRFLAGALGLRPREVTLVRGEAARDKVVLVSGLARGELEARLTRLLEESGA
jgi:uncharacterized protein (TIGR00251 family)